MGMSILRCSEVCSSTDETGFRWAEGVFSVPVNSYYSYNFVYPCCYWVLLCGVSVHSELQVSMIPHVHFKCYETGWALVTNGNAIEISLACIPNKRLANACADLWCSLIKHFCAKTVATPELWRWNSGFKRKLPEALRCNPLRTSVITSRIDASQHYCSVADMRHLVAMSAELCFAVCLRMSDRNVSFTCLSWKKGVGLVDQGLWLVEL